MTSKTAIRAESLSKRYSSGGRVVEALRGVSLDIEMGEFVAIAGRSGSGKTTLLNILGGLDTEFSGSVVVMGTDLSSLNDGELSRFRNRTVGFVFQGFHLLNHLSVLENVLLPCFFGDDVASADSRAREILKLVGLDHVASASPSELSAGERQRVAIARAVVTGPKVLLCDEPTGNLDEHTARGIIELFEELNRTEGTTLVVATHSRDVASAAGRRLTLDTGRITG